MEIKRVNPKPALDVLHDAELELLERIERQRKRYNNYLFSLKDSFDRALSTLILPTEKAPEYGHGILVRSPNFVLPEWHRRWRPKFLEKMKVVSLRQFEEEVRNHHFLCAWGSDEKSRGLRICSDEAYNAERVVAVPPTSDGWVYKFCKEFNQSLMTTVANLRVRGTYNTQADTNYLDSPADILLKVQERNALDCFNPMELFVLEDSRLALKEKPVSILQNIDYFLQAGIGIGVDADNTFLFLTKNDYILCIKDLRPGNLGRSKGGIKVVDGPSALFKASDMPKEYQWLSMRLPLEKRVGVHEQTFAEWKENQTQRNAQKREIERGLIGCCQYCVGEYQGEVPLNRDKSSKVRE